MQLLIHHRDERLAIYSNMYGDQITNLNSLIRGVVDSILEDSKTPPVIIIQGDHRLRVTADIDP